MNDLKELLANLAGAGLCVLFTLAIFAAIGCSVGVAVGAMIMTIRYMIGA